MALKGLRPKMNNTGSSSVQVDRAGGSVNVINVSQSTPAVSDGGLHIGHVGGSVTHHHVQLTQHIYAAAEPRSPRAAMPAKALPALTSMHKEVLGLMQPLPRMTRSGVLAFMRREFGTSMVKELGPREVHRVKRYVEQIRASSARRRTHEFL